MKLIIDIPDKVYKYIQREWEDSEFDSIHDLALNGIKHGIPLEEKENKNESERMD